MTNVSNIIDQLSTIVEAQVAGVTSIPDPYDPESNNDLYLQNGYAIGFGSVQRARTVMCGRVYLRREFQIMLFRMVAATEQDGSAIKTSSKAILEDELKIIKAIENDTTLGGYAINAEFTDGDALQYLEGDRGRYWQLITAFSVEYAESLT